MNKLKTIRNGLQFALENHRTEMIIVFVVGAILGGLFVAIT